MAKYTSGKQKNLKVGIVSYSENLTSLEVIGNVGIGTTIATSKLWVNGDAYFAGIVTGNTFSPSSGYIKAPDGTNSFYIYNGTGNVAFQGTIGVSQINSSSGYKVIDFDTTSTPSVNIANNLNVGISGTIFTTDLNGNVGVGTTNPTSKLWVNGDGYFTGIITANDINSSSDIRLKKNIKKFENTLEKIDTINGVTFEWKQSNTKSAGIIAQELEEVFPELVINSDEYKKVNYNGLIGVLVESIKELKKEVEYLKSKIDN